MLAKGLSLDAVGRSITWNDVIALLASPDDTPHVQQKLYPDQAARARWLAPEVAIIGFAHDSLKQTMLQVAGAKPDFINSQPGLITRVLETFAPDEKPKPVRRKEKTAAEIYAAVEAAYSK